MLPISHEQIKRWRAVADGLRLEIVAPFEMDLAPGRLYATALIKHFGNKNGIVVDPVWGVLEPHARALIEAGYAYSCVEIGPEAPEHFIDMLRDWGWSGSRRAEPQWLKREH